MAFVFVTGGTGYLGSRAIPALLARGHRVRALVRPGSESVLPAGCDIVSGDPLVAETFAATVAPCDSFLQLVGTPKPSPAKAADFERVDFASVRASVEAAVFAGVRHFIYLSVAQPAPIMQAYVNVRARGEALIREAGLPATMLRPWYVIGPGHHWPLIMVPLYALWKALPATRAAALRLDLIPLDAMVRSIVLAVEQPSASGVRIREGSELRSADPW